MTLATAFRAILRLLRMSAPTTLEGALFPQYKQGANYQSTLYFALRSTLDGPAARKALQGYTVAKVTCCKEPSHPQHEYVVAEVRGFKDEQVGTLRFERSAVRGTDDSYTTQISTSSDSLFKDKVLASDTVVRAVTVIHADNSLKSIHFTRHQRPTLMDLYTTLSIINKHSEFYSLLHHQCYWFADVFSSVLESLCEPKSVDEEREWAALNEAQENSATSAFGPSQGACHSVSIPQGRDKKAVIEKLLGELKESREEFRALIQQLEREAKEVVDTKKRADDLERLVKEEKKRTDQEIAEMRRLHGEQQRQAEEDKKRAEAGERRAEEELVGMRRLLREQQA